MRPYTFQLARLCEGRIPGGRGLYVGPLGMDHYWLRKPWAVSTVRPRRTSRMAVTTDPTLGGN